MSNQPREAEDLSTPELNDPNANSRQANTAKESHDLLVEADSLEVEEAREDHLQADLAEGEPFQTQRSDGHTMNPHVANEQGLTYTPPTDPPTLPSIKPEDAEMGAGFAPNLETSTPTAERLPPRIRQADLNIKQKIETALKTNSETINLEDVNVHVKDGVVYLLGSVPTQADAQRLASLLPDMDAVNRVHSHLQVKTSTKTVSQEQSTPPPRQKQNQPQHPEGSINRDDEVDEAAWESFPTSDPPAWTSRRD